MEFPNGLLNFWSSALWFSSKITEWWFSATNPFLLLPACLQDSYIAFNTMQLCTLRSGGKKLLSDTLVLLIISNLYFCVNVVFFLFVYHDFRVRSLCKYPCPVSGMTLSVHFFTSFFLFTGTVRPYTSSSSHLPFFGLDLLPVGLPFALCLQRVCSLTFTSTCFPPHPATRKRYLEASSTAVLVVLNHSTVLLTPALEQEQQNAGIGKTCWRTSSPSVWA